MIVMMDMSSGSRLDDEESLPFAQECLTTKPVAQTTPQMGTQLGFPQLGLQLAVSKPAQRPVLRIPPRSTATSFVPISDDAWQRH